MHPMACLIYAVGGIFLMLLDIAATLVLIDVVVKRWPAKWLVLFDTAGKPLTSAMYAALDQKVEKLWGKRLTDGAKSLVCILVLFVVRMVAGSLMMALAR